MRFEKFFGGVLLHFILIGNKAVVITLRVYVGKKKPSIQARVDEELRVWVSARR